MAANRADREGQELRRLHRDLDAAQRYEQAYLLRLSVLGEDALDVAKTMTAAGQCYSIGGEPLRGLELLRRALPVLEEHLGTMHASVAGTLYAMAGAEYHLGRLDEAEAHQRRALQIFEQIPPSDLAYANGLAQLGRVLLAKDRVAEAQRLHSQALAIRQRLRPPSLIFVAESQNDLGAVFDRMGNLPAAEAMYKQALETQEKAAATNTIQYTQYMRDYAAVLYQTGRHADAEAVARRALSVARQLHGVGDLEVGRCLGLLGLILIKTGDLAAAEPMLRQALSIRERALGPEHEATLSSLVFLAQVLSKRGDGDGAEVLLRRYMVAEERHYGKDSVQAGVAALNLAERIRDNGKHPEAEALYLRSFNVAMRADAEYLPRVMLSLGTSHEELKLNDKWEMLFGEAITLMRGRGKQGELRLSQGLRAFGKVLANRQEWEKAKAALQESLEIRERRLGRNHPATLEILEELKQVTTVHNGQIGV
jgi:tetratricopeptide (TPR) repeat protein